jgi:hypothetical protein
MINETNTELLKTPKIIIAATPSSQGAPSSSEQSITITATPSRLCNRATLSPVQTYTHESPVILNGKIYRFKLDIAVKELPTEKESLDQAIKTYKEKFIEHLKKQDQPIIRSGKAFDIEFQGEKGYKLSEVVPSNVISAELPTQPLPDVFVENEEALHFTNLICADDQSAEDLITLLSTPQSYAVPQKTSSNVPTTQQSTQTEPTNSNPTPVLNPTQNSSVETNPPDLKIEEQPRIAPSPTTAPEDSDPVSRISTPSISKIEHTTNSCYLASTLWYLDKDDVVRNALTDAINISTEESDKKQLLKTLQRLLEQMQRGEGLNENEINKFRDDLKKVYPNISPDGQEDANDVINYLLKTLDLECLYFLKDTAFEPDTTINPTPIEDRFELRIAKGKAIPLEISINDGIYKLSKALCHKGVDNNGHYNVVSLKGNGKYYLCDDTKRNSSIDGRKLNEHLKDHAVRLLYIKQPKMHSLYPLKDANVIFLSETDNKPDSYKIYTPKEDFLETKEDFSKLKEDLVELALENQKGSEIVISTKEKLSEIEAHIERLSSLNENPIIQSGSIAFEAPSSSDNIRSVQGKVGEKSEVYQVGEQLYKKGLLSDLFAEYMNPSQDSTSRFDELIFNLRSCPISKDEFVSGKYQPVINKHNYNEPDGYSMNRDMFIGADAYETSDEQTTLKAFLDILKENPLPQNKKIRLIISKDILLKNFEDIEQALESASKLKKTAEAQKHPESPNILNWGRVLPSWQNYIPLFSKA